MSGVNKVILIGHSGKDPEVKSLNAGGKVASFTLATTESYKDKNGERLETTEWHNIVFYGPIVQVIEKYLQKGSLCYIEGKLKSRSYEDKNGVKKYITEVIGNTINILNLNKDNSKKEIEVKEPDETEDLPY